MYINTCFKLSIIHSVKIILWHLIITSQSSSLTLLTSMFSLMTTWFSSDSTGVMSLVRRETARLRRDSQSAWPGDRPESLHYPDQELSDLPGSTVLSPVRPLSPQSTQHSQVYLHQHRHLPVLLLRPLHLLCNELAELSVRPFVENYCVLFSWRNK